MSKENRVSDELARKLDALAAHFEAACHVGDAYMVEENAADAKTLRDAAAALRSKPVAGVEAKPLEWHGPDVNDEIYARSVLCIYRIQKQRKSMGFWLTEVGGNFQSIEEAKAAAEADYRQRILSALLPKATAPVVSEPVQRYRHKKRGTVYELIGIGKMQAEAWRDPSLKDGTVYGPSVDMREVAVYRSADNPDEIWVRPREEFQDGRFALKEARNG